MSPTALRGPGTRRPAGPDGRQSPYGRRPGRGGPAVPPAWTAPAPVLRGDRLNGAGAAPVVVESRMPTPAGPSGPGAVLRAAGLVIAALAVAIGYVGLPLALAVRALLGALPQALLFATAVVVLGTVGILAVLRRTELVLLPRGRRDIRRHGPGPEHRRGTTAPSGRRALLHAGPTAPPTHRSTVHGTAGAWAPPDAAGRHRTTPAGRRAGHRSRRR